MKVNIEKRVTALMKMFDNTINRRPFLLCLLYTEHFNIRCGNAKGI